MKRLALIAFALSGCSYIPGTDANTEKLSKALLDDTLYDGASARYKSTVAVTYEREGETRHGWCGLINAKNQFGAYIGYRRFVVVPAREVAQIDNPDAMGETREALEAKCASAQSNAKRFTDLPALKETARLICTQTDQAIANLEAQETFLRNWDMVCSKHVELPK